MATNKKKTDLDKFLSGTVPPNSVDLEKIVLGVMMMVPEKIMIVKEVLTPNHFYSEAHKAVCQAIYDLTDKNMLADMVGVTLSLQKNGKLELAGGAYGITNLTLNFTVRNSVDTLRYCHEIKETFARRVLINLGNSIFVKLNDNTEDVSVVLSESLDILSGVNNDLMQSDRVSLADVAMEFLKKRATRLYNERNDIIDPDRVRTGFMDWDAINGDLDAGVYVVAGRPGMGKGVHMTESICRMAQTMEIGVINGEMTNEQLLTRLGCNLLNFGNNLYEKNGKYVTQYEEEMIQDAIGQATLKLKLHIYDGTRIDKIANKIRLWVKMHGVKCIFADFLTLFKVPEHMERQNITDTQKTNKVLEVFVTLAKELKIPIILYAQMNREILGRAGVKEPNLADLKSSGNIEEYAYQVAFLHRPEYYVIPGKEDEEEDAQFDEPGLTWFIIAKHRGGRLGRFKLQAELDKSQMKDWYEKHYHQKAKEDFLGTIDDEDDKQSGLPYKD